MPEVMFGNLLKPSSSVPQLRYRPQTSTTTISPQLNHNPPQYFLLGRLSYCIAPMHAPLPYLATSEAYLMLLVHGRQSTSQCGPSSEAAINNLLHLPPGRRI